MNEQAKTQASGSAKPDLIAKVKEGSGENASFHTIGAAWSREDGSIYLKPYGKQILDQPLYLFPVNKKD